jgi:hypothetical protein
MKRDKVLTVRVPPGLADAVRALADRRSCDVASTVRWLVSHGLEREGQRPGSAHQGALEPVEE